MQTQTTINNTVHIKAQHNDEFRRFSLSEITFAALETMLRTLFSIPSEPIKVKFMDDEKDWILISSDMELEHAVEISTFPIRVQVSLSGQVSASQNASESIEKQENQADAPETNEDFCWRRRGGCHGRGMGRGCGGGGRGPMISKEERLALKKARIAGRISALETALLDPSLPPERERTISWKLENLKYKLDTLETMKDSLASEPQGEEHSRPWRKGPGPCGGEMPAEGEFHCRGPCGRGRGGRRGRGRQENQETTTETEGDHCGKKWVVPKESWSHFQECKENLKVARQSGDAEAIKVAYEAFVLAKEKKKETRYPKK